MLYSALSGCGRGRRRKVSVWRRPRFSRHLGRELPLVSAAGSVHWSLGTNSAASRGSGEADGLFASPHRRFSSHSACPTKNSRGTSPKRCSVVAPQRYQALASDFETTKPTPRSATQAERTTCIHPTVPRSATVAASRLHLDAALRADAARVTRQVVAAGAATGLWGTVEVSEYERG